MKTDSLKQIIENVIKNEIKNAIVENTTAEVYIIKNKETGEPVEYCDTEEEANTQLDSYNAQGKEFIIEKGAKPSIDELDAMAEENTNEMKQEKPMKPIDEKLIGKQKNIDANKNGKIDKEDLSMLRGKKTEMDEDWGSSDQTAFNRFVHQELGEPESFPFDLEAVQNAVEEAVDYYWSDWDEYQTDRDGLIDHAAKRYYMAYFRETFEKMEQMFAPRKEESDMNSEKGMDAEEMREGMQSCSECGGMMNEEGMCNECGSMMNESKKKVRLTESELVKLIKTIAESVPGLETYKRAHKGSGEINRESLSKTEKIIKKSRTEYVSKFIDWKNTKKGQTKIKSVSSFRVLSNIASNKNNTSLLNDDQRKLIERAASYERYKYKLAELSSKKVKDKTDLTKIASLEKALGISANKLDKKYKDGKLDVEELKNEINKLNNNCENLK